MFTLLRRKRATLIAFLCAVLLGLGSTLGATSALASDVDEAVADTTTPVNAVTLAPGASNVPVTITLTITGKQEGTATFQVYKDWALSGGTFTGSGVSNVSINPRPSGTGPSVITLAGHVSVASGQAAGTFTLAVGAFNITNSNTNGAKLRAGTLSNYQVTVTPPPDTVAPVLTLPSDISVEAVDSAGATVNYTATANDAVDGAITPTCTPASGSKFPIGQTTVNCSATDAHGNTAHGSFKVSVTDSAAPVVTVPGDITLEATGPTGAVANYTATASDLIDGSVSVTCDTPSGATFPIGTTLVTCSATDAHNNTGHAGFNVTVRDTTAPTLNLANQTAEATGSTGAVVNFDATASDLVDGVVPVVCTPASGSNFPVGNTTVNCSATDAAGNTAHGTLKVSVLDTTPPVITAPNVTKEATGPTTAVTFGATATDLVDGSVSVTYSPDGPFSVGTHTVTATAKDAHDNTATKDFTVTITDTTAPALALPNDITKEATGPNGATASFTASANDLVDGSVSVSCDSASGSTFPLGATTVSCSAADAHGNSANGTFKVTVQDTTAPTLHLPANITKTATGNSQAAASFTATADDLVDGSVSVTCNHTSGSNFPVGETTVNCSATDAHGNTANGSFTVTVSYAWTGFFQPIDNNGVFNKAKAGSTIPVKFSLGGDQGLNVLSGTPGVAITTLTAGALTDDIETISTATVSGLKYDATANQYIYNWKTDLTYAGKSYVLKVKLADGTTHSALFTFTK